MQRDLEQVKSSTHKPIHHCHLYVSFKWKLDTSCDVRKVLQPLIGCPVLQAHSLQKGKRSAYKVKIDRNHLWYALSSQEKNQLRVRLWKNSSNLHSKSTYGVCLHPLMIRNSSVSPPGIVEGLVIVNHT